MDIGFSLIVVLVVAAHILLILGVVFDLRKHAICICGHRFNLPDVGDYICPGCRRMHLTVKV